MIIAVLCALGVAGRAVFFMLPNFKPVMALVIIAGVAFGGETGFLVGAVTMLASNMLFGQGPWTPWQMFAMGIIGFLAGVLFRKGILRRARLSLAIFGALIAVVIYGGIMNPASALLWARSLEWKILLTYYATAFPSISSRPRRRSCSSSSPPSRCSKAGPHQGQIRPGGVTAASS